MRAALATNPETLDSGHFYLFILENDPESLYQLTRRWVEQKHPLAFAIGLAAADQVGWPTSRTMRADPRYAELLNSLGLQLL